MSIYRTFKCPCGDAVCNKWMVSPGADFQCCGWDKETAQAVTDFLNNGQAENDRLREALEQIVANTEEDAIKTTYEHLAKDVCDCARAALAKEPAA